MSRPQVLKYKSDNNIDVDESADLVVGHAATLHGWFIHNKNAATLYVKFYNKATAATVGTDTPKLTIPIPTGASANVEFTGGIEFALGISVGATTGVATADTGAPAANDCIVETFYL